MSSTVVITLSQSAWLPLGASPALVAVNGGEACLVLADAAPDANAIGFKLRPTDLPLPIQASGQLWGRATSALNTQAVVLLGAA